MVKRYYDQFVDLVADARDKPVEYIEELAQGRVWLGTEALRSGLIDQIGEIEAAISKAAELAGVTEYDVEYLQQSAGLISPLDSFAERVRTKIAENLLPINSIRSYLTSEIKYLRDPSNVYARCADCSVVVQ